jgi:hypothetical protein
MKDLKKIQEFFSKPLEEAELKLGVKYELPNGDTGYFQMDLKKYHTYQLKRN